jgi:large subunit ribosomal protein L15
MNIGKLAPAKGARKLPYRKGRGIGSGWGKTAGYGAKGQKARKGSKGTAFEGGQMPLAQRFPKRGFHNPFRVAYAPVNLKDLATFAAGTVVDPAALYAQGLAHKPALIKILGDGAAPKGVTVKAHKFSKTAAEKLTAAGSKTEVLA